MYTQMTGNAAANLPMDGKKAYWKPELKNFGSVSALTMSGTGSQVEADGPGSSCISDRNKRSCK